MNPTTRGRLAALTSTLLMAVLATIALATPASAAAFRYWSYWQGASGEWVAAQTGPGDHTVVDRDVQGWRFTLTTEMPTQGPDNAPDFAALCPDLAASAAPAGQVRVAVVIDSGFVADSPQGQAPPADVVSCVTVAEGSTGNQALAAAATISDQDGLVCSVNGYPEGECGAPVSDADAAAAAEAAAAEQPNPATIAAPAETTSEDSDADSRSTIGFVVGAALIILLLGAAYAIPAARRRSRANAE